MSTHYRAVQWDAQKRRYDMVLAGGVAAALGAFMGVTAATNPNATAETLLIRGTAWTAILLLHVVLAIGPLARLDRRFLALHYNRRHLGVAMFFLALVHAFLSTFQFHALGDALAPVSALTAYAADYASLAHFPFEAFGAAALAILFLMAATSHDFWLRNLGAGFWKRLHQSVYAAYGLLQLHVFFGVIQSERSPAFPAVMAAGAATLLVLHLAASRRAALTGSVSGEGDPFVATVPASEVPESHGKVVRAGGTRIALFRDGGRIFATSNVCRHQGGPLGEGRVRDGCVTCPWHGWTYQVRDGVSPPPFKETIATFRTEVREGVVFVDPSPLATGTACDGAAAPPAEAREAEFFVGYLPQMPAGVRRVALAFSAAACLVVAGMMALLAASQARMDDGFFDFGNVQRFEGDFRAAPLPVLRVETQDYLLVGEGKFAIPASLAALDGKRLALAGTLIEREGRRMIEVASAPPEVLGDAPAAEAARRAIPGVTLVGEVLDLKCFLGVMRPAVGKVHRGCAIRCLSGGVPAGFRVVAADGREQLFLVAGTEALDPRVIGVPAEVTGDIEIVGDLAILRIRKARRL